LQVTALKAFLVTMQFYSHIGWPHMHIMRCGLHVVISKVAHMLASITCAYTDHA